MVYTGIDPVEFIGCECDVDLSEKQAYRDNIIGMFVPIFMDIDVHHICTLSYLVGFNT
jgi:hypothetical protein